MSTQNCVTVSQISRIGYRTVLASYVTPNAAPPPTNQLVVVASRRQRSRGKSHRNAPTLATFEYITPPRHHKKNSMDCIKNLHLTDNLVTTSFLGGFIGLFSVLAAMGLLSRHKNHLPVEGKVSEQTSSLAPS